jgi:malate dehydrogenase (oxaloacetate-decarboxylating)
VRPEQLAYARSDEEVRAWRRPDGHIALVDVVRHVQPTVLIGVSAHPGAFTEAAVREMARHVARPIIFPLSNPTSCCEATAQELMDWTGGRALVGAGSPFAPVDVGGRTVRVAQTNNSYIFPGLALGIIAARAARVTDGMVMAAARELARHAPTLTDPAGALLPPLAHARSLSRAIARAVGRQALRDGQAAVADEDEVDREIETQVWEPEYVPYEPAAPGAG